jgi:hypothetical protein
MCFSPEADAIAGVVVSGIGIDALRHVREPRQIAFASLPLLFGLHQLSEAFVWWGLSDDVPHTIERVALWAYLLFALGFLPVLVPASVALLERSPHRRAFVVGCGIVGAVVGAILVVAMLRGAPIHVAIDGRHVEYAIGVAAGGVLTAIYVAVTCGALIASSERDVSVIGVANLVAVPVLVWLTLGGFVSLWCFWAALVSVLIARYLRRAPRRGHLTLTSG